MMFEIKNGARLSARLQAAAFGPIDCAAQHFGVWAVEPLWMRSAFAAWKSGAITSIVAAHGEPGEGEGDAPYQAIGRTAVIAIHGSITKYGSSYGGTSTLALRRDIRHAQRSDAIDSIMLHVDSPGGTIDGMDDLASDVAAVTKPLHAHADGLMASAGYWASAPAGRITATRSSQIGSIGVYTILADTSGMAKKDDVIIHEVSTGKFKAIGAAGVPITDEQLAEVQRMVDGIGGMFFSAVAAGRGMSDKEVATIADGRIWLAEDALENGLIDGVESFEQAMETLQAEAASAGRPLAARRALVAARLRR